MMILMMMMLNSNPLLIISGSHATYCNERIYGKDRRCKWWITFQNGMCVTWLEESHNCADNSMEKGVRFSLSQTKKGTAGLIDQFGSDVIGPLSVKLIAYSGACNKDPQLQNLSTTSIMDFLLRFCSDLSFFWLIFSWWPNIFFGILIATKKA